MVTRRDFLTRALAGAAGAMASKGNALAAAGRRAWPGPIGLELYTVRQLFAEDPGGTLKKVAAAGYKEVEIGPGGKPDMLKSQLRDAGLSAPSGYFDSPKSIDDWKKTVDQAHGYGLRYIVVGDNPELTADAWKRRAGLYNECGRLSRHAEIQFCYHAHFREFATVDDTTGYDILLKRCEAKLLKMEMDIFWVTYAGKDPLTYWRRYPGRFPMLHIKDMTKGVTIHHQEDPAPDGPNPFAPVGQGIIDWSNIFKHVALAGAEHIFVEQDRCDQPPLEAIKISHDYLKHLRVS